MVDIQTVSVWKLVESRLYATCPVCGSTDQPIEERVGPFGSQRHRISCSRSCNVIVSLDGFDPLKHDKLRAVEYGWLTAKREVAEMKARLGG